MAETHAKGLAVAVIENGRPALVRAYGVRNLAGAPLETTTVMYGASLTKTIFADLVLQLADAGRIGLDTPIDHYLAKPLPDYSDPDIEKNYATYRDLAGDERWRKLTPRILLAHGSGFANYGFMEPDQKLRFHFEPGARYSYSGDGYILLQFVLEHGLGIDVQTEMQRRVFGPLGMVRSSLVWREEFGGNKASGWDATGKAFGHALQDNARAAGSMDTTIEDMARFAGAFVRGDGLSARGRREQLRGGFPITVFSQFPVLQPELPMAERRADLAAGLGVITFSGPQGRGAMKGGHNDVTANLMVCLARGRRCVVLLSNDVRSEIAFQRIVDGVLGPSAAPWRFEYGSPVSASAPQTRDLTPCATSLRSAPEPDIQPPCSG